MDGVENIPYGVRWTCKQLGELSKKRFPDSDRYQIGSLIGGYVYLRFFNPVIATPDSVNFISVKPSKTMRRNLVLIAKVLQNLSNGILFGDKEQYMKPLNKFIQERMDSLQDYFDRLTAVDDLDDTVAVDKLMEHTQRQMPVIQISLNQIFLLHSLCEKHLKTLVQDEKDPLVSVLKALGPAPAQVEKAQNRTVALQLTDRRQQRIGTAVTEGFGSPKVNPMYIKSKQALLDVLKKLPTSTEQNSILDFLEEQRDNTNDTHVAEQVGSVLQLLKSLMGMNLMTKGKTQDETFNMFLWAFAQEAATRRKRITQIAKKLVLIKSALKTIDIHHSYLQGRLELYKIYLDNARKGQAQGESAQSAEKKKAASAKTLKVTSKKFTHTELTDQGVLTKILIDAPSALLKKCYYIFTMDSPGKFKVEVHIKQGVDLTLLKKPIELVLEDLLTKQERNEQLIEVDAVQLNVNLLIHLLNKNFMQHR
jgi:Ras GTPase-activating-like protein IQGAP2/3